MENQRFNILTLLLLNFFCLSAFSQQYKCDYEVISDSTVLIKAVYNNDKDHFIRVYIDGANDNAFCGKVGANDSLTINKNCSRFVKVEIQGGSMTTILNAEIILQRRPAIKEKNKLDSVELPVSQEQTPFQNIKDNRVNVSKNVVKKIGNSSVEASEVINAFKKYSDTISCYYSEEHQDVIEGFIEDFINKKYSGIVINDKQRCLDEMHAVLQSKLKERKDAITVLEKAITGDTVTAPSRQAGPLLRWVEAITGGSVAAMFDKILSDKSMLKNIGIAILVLIILLVIVFKVRRKKAARTPTVLPIDAMHQNAQADIVVRRKTTSILKKQSLEDVRNNPAYLKVDCEDFCEDSAVRRIYFKNSCIKDIYNMFSEDLRNPENPNEDGCMVLGRWVHDAEADEYYVSLEEIVKPGDDAVLMEYELNFGGKIKLKVSEKLRKLRRETNLQYDMTCWVHSHPGLGVFFSNADSGVQMQLKHPTHPKFLIAIVIDILTPDQELGIFTFKHDMSINSKLELKKMYSLEEMYKWAVLSDRNSFKAEDYYNLMLTSKDRIDSCYGVQLSNGAIIDMCQMEAEQQFGLVGWVQGYNCRQGSRNEFVAKSVSKEEIIPDNDVLGCFMIGSHRSLPTIRKAISNVDKIQFVLFYSTSDKMLTAIPVVNGLLSVEENYYGEEKLEELKIWTRRKR